MAAITALRAHHALPAPYCAGGRLAHRSGATALRTPSVAPRCWASAGGVAGGRLAPPRRRSPAPACLPYLAIPRYRFRGMGVVAASSDGMSAGAPAPGGASKRALALGIGVAATALVAIAAGGYAVMNPVVATEMMKRVAASGFAAAFALIFLSEIGDKTFFIAALLAMKKGRTVVLTGATAALAVMTVISVAIGRLFKQLPRSFETSLPVGEYLAVALLVFFGARTIIEAHTSEEDDAGEGGEYTDAVSTIDEAEQGEKLQGEGVVAGLLETFSLIFVAEWGDRSMLATIALGAAQNPVGVVVGATLGHFLATLIAVVGGALASGYVSERVVGYVGGTLFIVFAVLTAMGIF